MIGMINRFKQEGTGGTFGKLVLLLMTKSYLKGIGL